MVEISVLASKNHKPNFVTSGPVTWISIVIGAPVVTVVLDHVITGLSQREQWVRIVLWIVFLSLHVLYTVILRKQIRIATVNLIGAKKSALNPGLLRTAAAIASAVTLGLSLIVSLILLDYYGHRGAADFILREANFSEAQAELREKERIKNELFRAEAKVAENTKKNEKLPSDAKASYKVSAEEQAKKKHLDTFKGDELNVRKSSHENIHNREGATPAVKAEETQKVEGAFKSPNAAKPVANSLEKAGMFLGTFGDFLGGVLNPLLTFGTLVALAITILLQRTQLELAEDSASRNSAVMEKQAFETTFFNMLNLHNTTVQDLKFDPKTIEIPAWHKDATEMEEDIDFDNRNPDMLLTPINMAESEGRQVFERVLQLMDSKLHPSPPNAVYHRIQKYHNYVLGHYFRTLYQLLELVEEYSEEAGHEEATRYSSIIRAQLSANELILLFYNCGYELVDTGQFRKLLKRYEILEHMPLRLGSEPDTLDTPGYSFEIEHHIDQYFKRPEDGDHVFSKAGAFGENPVVRDFLERKAIYVDN